MNEQDIMNKINEETKNIPIPDSISPEAMKKMLDEQVKQNPNQNKVTTFNRRRIIRGLSAAACMVLVVSGAWGLSRVNKSDTTSTDTAIGAYEKSEDVASDDCYVSDSPENTDNALEDDIATGDTATDSIENNQTDPAVPTTVVSGSSFKNPSSYEDFCQAALAAQKKYQRESNLRYKFNKNSIDYLTDDAIEETADVEADYDATDSASDEIASSNSTDAMDSSDSATSDQDYSTTNTQEATIDEGDLVKTDGSYIYRFTKNSTSDTNPFQIHIIKADNGKMTETSIINSYDLPDCNSSSNVVAQEIYLQNNKLILLYHCYNYLSRELTNTTYICTFDVTDKSNPQLIGSISQSGDYTTSRISDGYLYTISTIRNNSYGKKEIYDDYIPKINGEMLSCEDIYYSTDYLMNDMQVITSVNLNTPDKVSNSVSLPIQGGTVYVSQEAIYIYSNAISYRSATQIMKVFYHNGSFVIGKDTSFAGYLYGPFAINEYNGYLRIVATIPGTRRSTKRSVIDILSKSNKVVIDVTGDIDKTTNALYVLDENLALTGSISNIAKDEQIYSARFMGDTGYFVTYRNMDPLFSVDLSDPKNPTLIGALKIPGFSTYLHPYGDGILLGIGKEMDPDTQQFEGLKLSMFDIKDPTNVTEKDKQIIKYSQYSSALTDYKAVMIDTDKNIFGFAYVSDTVDRYDNDVNLMFATFSYDENKGFINTGVYNLKDFIDTEDPYYYAEDAFIRGIYIGDYLYISSDDLIESFPLYKNEVFDQLKF